MTTNEQAVAVLAHRTAQGKAQPRKITKIARIAGILRSGVSLNLFDGERVGDHCLNSTISVLRAEGMNIVDEWEEVPNRFGGMTRVKRYRYVGGRHE